MATRNELISDILMGAAFADDRLEGAEYDAVKRALAKAMGVDEVPPVLAARLEWFKPDEYDMEKTVAQLDLETASDKRQLLELIVSIQEADEVYDLDEDAYLRGVAEALGLPPEAYEDLAIQDLEFEAGRDSILMPPPLPDTGSKRPPPLPGQKK